MKVQVNAAVLAAGVVIGAVAASWLAPLPARAADDRPAYREERLPWGKAIPDVANRLDGDGYDLVAVLTDGRTLIFKRKP